MKTVETLSSPCGWLDLTCTPPGYPSGNQSPCAYSGRRGQLESRQKALTQRQSGRGVTLMPHVCNKCNQLWQLTKWLTSQKNLHCMSQKYLALFLGHDRTTSEWGLPTTKIPQVITPTKPNSTYFTKQFVSGFLFNLQRYVNQYTANTSSSSLKTVKGPSYSGLGVNSKSSMFSETISLLVIRKPFKGNRS